MTRRSLPFRLIRGALVALAAAYVLIVVALWYWQASFIFLPDPGISHTPGESGVKFDKVSLAIGSDRVTGWWVPSDDPRAKTLLYLHGNAANVGANADHILRLRSAGLNVLIIDYRGYGESTGGPPRESLVYEDAERAWTYLTTERHIAPAAIVIYGHSLGGAVAIELARRHPDAGGMITEDTFTSVADIAHRTRYAYIPVRLILTERFDSISKIGSVRVPKLILHGEADTMTPLDMARQLYAAAPEPKQIAFIPGGGHQDSAEVNPTAYFAALKGFLARYGLTPDAN